MTPLNLPTPAADDAPDYAAHVLRKLQARFELLDVERIDTVHGDVTFYAWHMIREAYVCYLLYPRFLVKGAVQALQTQTDEFALAYPAQTKDFPVLTGLVVPGATETAARLYQRLFDLPLLTIPIPSAFVPMESEVML